jgi:hypothetical protein
MAEGVADAAETAAAMGFGLTIAAPDCAGACTPGAEAVAARKPIRSVEIMARSSLRRCISVADIS